MTFALTAKSKTKPVVSGKYAAKRKPLPNRSVVEPLPGLGALGGRSAIAPTIQPKLKIGEPNDKFEQEADRVANRIMQLSDREIEAHAFTGETSLSPGLALPQVQRLCSECREQDMLQTKKAEGNSTSTASSSDSQSHWIPSHGEPLPQSVRSFFEPRFGLSFNQVRIHTGRHAAQLARSLHAKAFTLGQNVVFGASEYQPQTQSGKKLLAHELTHVVQQNGSTKQAGLTPLIQRASPSLPSLPEPDVECSVDILALGRILAGDRAAARQVIDCCVNVPKLGRGCTSQAIKAACALLPQLCGGGSSGGEKVRCPLGFRPARAEGFRGKCCREGTVVESDRDCCFPQQITTGAPFPRCCPPPTVPNPGRTDCVTLPPPPIVSPPIPTPQPPPTSPSTQSRTLLPITLFFFFDSTIRRPESNDRFALVLSTLQAIPRLRVQLTGHTSLEGSADYNLRLGQRRADAIRAELVIAGIDSSRISTLSLGETAPAVTEPDVAGRSLSPRVEDIRNQNRRVEVVFIDPEGEFAPSIPPMTLRQPALGSSAPNLSPSLNIPRLRF